ncbi:F0F1 ATP synthase subunit B [Spongiivirga sp. MCCC 1A20706]|uniref:F0F1 ATP synthase subunit B n=1 Tax=Spongiivirga sp. MCCC 1A20706 TaxID=3160963 RepID=UPI003977596C
MELVQPGFGLVFWTAITFIFLLLLLRKLAWKPILGAVSDREQSIKDALASAEDAKKEMQNLQADNENLLKEARAEREAMIKDAREVKVKMIDEAKNEAKAEAAKIMEQAKTAIESERKAAVADLKKQVADLSVEIAEKVVKGELADKSKQADLVDKLLGETTLN